MPTAKAGASGRASTGKQSSAPKTPQKTSNPTVLEGAGTAYPHLYKTALAKIELSDAERITHILQGGWMSLSSSAAFLAEMEQLLKLTGQTRPRNLLLLGPPNSGKTTILERFEVNHPIDLNPDAECTTATVVRIDCPDGPDRDALCIRLLEAVFAKFRPGDKYEIHLNSVRTIYGKIGTKIVIVDEIHNALEGTLRQQKLFFNCLRNISNFTKLHFVFAGIPKATGLIGIDDQMTSRFKPFRLPEWVPGAGMGQLLATLESRMPLKLPSDLKSPEKMEAIYKRAGSRLGDIIDLVQSCGVEAIRAASKPDGSGKSKVKEDISLTLIKNLAWSAPSDRESIDRFTQL